MSFHLSTTNLNKFLLFSSINLFISSSCTMLNNCTDNSFIPSNLLLKFVYCLCTSSSVSGIFIMYSVKFASASIVSFIALITASCTMLDNCTDNSFISFNLLLKSVYCLCTSLIYYTL